MADFSTGTDTANNPADWFDGSNDLASYSYDGNNDKISLDFTADFLTSKGIGDSDLYASNGDVRSVYLAIAEALFDSYNAKDDAPATTSNRLKMTRSQAVDSTNNIRYTTYTIHIQEDGTGTAESFSSTGVRAE